MTKWVQEKSSGILRHFVNDKTGLGQVDGVLSIDKMGSGEVRGILSMTKLVWARSKPPVLYIATGRPEPQLLNHDGLMPAGGHCNKANLVD